MIASAWNVDPVKILTRREMTGVLDALASHCGSGPAKWVL